MPDNNAEALDALRRAGRVLVDVDLGKWRLAAQARRRKRLSRMSTPPASTPEEGQR